MNPAGAGFTLIELLVVISIISLLSTVIFAVFSTSRVQAQDAKKKEEVHQVTNALALYHSNENSYPQNYCTDTNCVSSGTRTFPALSSAENNAGVLNNDYHKSMKELVTRGTIASVPEDSSITAPYAYYNTGDSAVFFTWLNGGYGNIQSNQTFPSMLKTGAYGTVENPVASTTGCTGDNCIYVSGNNVFNYLKNLCFLELQSQFSQDYLSCLAVGPDSYAGSHGWSQCANPWTCDAFFRPPGGFSPYWPSCTYDGGMKYITSVCQDAPLFCVDNEGYTDDWCYWP